MLTRGQTFVATSNGETPVQLDMSHTGYRVRAGHRLRLHVASSDFPLYPWHPGTDESPWTATKGEPGRQTLRSASATPATVSVWVTDTAIEP